jgi:NAD(P)H-hydrate epimerase
MILLDAESIRKWDQYTIENEPISSLGLMERASTVFVDWFSKKGEFTNKQIIVFCGQGNNGGDGLAIARMLRDRFYEVSVVIVGFAKSTSEDLYSKRHHYH